jgi:hypothetical protein
MFTTPAKTKKSRSYSVSDIMNWKFEQHSFPGHWAAHLGEVPQRFLIYVDGDAGHGKTEYIFQMAKMLTTHFGKVRLNNVEQGKHLQVQQSIARNDYTATVPKGKFMLVCEKDFEKYKAMLRRPNSGRVQIIDSISYFPLSTEQVQELISGFPHKSFVFVAYQAHYNTYKPVRHLCDIKVRVENFVARVQASRFGGTEDFVIWEKPKKLNPQLSLIA